MHINHNYIPLGGQCSKTVVLDGRNTDEMKVTIAKTLKGFSCDYVVWCL